MADNVVLARNTDEAPQNDRFAQTVAFSHYNNISAQLPIDPETGAIVEGGIFEQAEQCFENLEAIVESIDHSLNDVARITVFVRDIRDMDVVDEVYRAFFTTYLPARPVALASFPNSVDYLNGNLPALQEEIYIFFKPGESRRRSAPSIALRYARNCMALLRISSARRVLDMRGSSSTS